MEKVVAQDLRGSARQKNQKKRRVEALDPSSLGRQGPGPGRPRLKSGLLRQLRFNQFAKNGDTCANPLWLHRDKA